MREFSAAWELIYSPATLAQRALCNPPLNLWEAMDPTNVCFLFAPLCSNTGQMKGSWFLQAELIYLFTRDKQASSEAD